MCCTVLWLRWWTRAILAILTHVTHFHSQLAVSLLHLVSVQHQQKENCTQFAPQTRSKKAQKFPWNNEKEIFKDFPKVRPNKMRICRSNIDKNQTDKLTISGPPSCTYGGRFFISVHNNVSYMKYLPRGTQRWKYRGLIRNAKGLVINRVIPAKNDGFESHFPISLKGLLRNGRVSS